MERTHHMAIDKEVLDQLLAGRDPQELFAKNGLIDELKKALSERMLAAELDDNLESEAEVGAGNRDRKRVVKGKSGSVRVDLGGRRRNKKKKNDRQKKNTN